MGSTAPLEGLKCVKCGQMTYIGLVHFCGTAVLPQRHPAEDDPSVEVHLQIGKDARGRMLAIAYANYDYDVVVLEAEVVKDEQEAHTWYERVKVEKPWLVR